MIRRRCAVAGGSLLIALAALTPAAAQTAPPLSNADPTLVELGKQVQDASLPEPERLALVKLLGEWGTAQVRGPLLALLKDPLPAIRAAAATGLGWEGNREAVPALRERIEAPGETPVVRAVALDSLGKIGDDSVREVVLAATNDPNASVREAALRAVTAGRLTTPKDRIPLLRRVAEDRGLDLLMRCEAIQELGKAKDTTAVPLLVRLLDSEPAVSMPLPRPAAPQREVMVVRFRQVRDVRAWAAMALGMLGAREALPHLLRSAEDPDDYFLRLTSVDALVGLNAPQAVPVFVRRLEDPFPDTRALALVGLARSGDRTVADAVLARLGDRVPKVRAEAAMALAELGDPRARSELENLRKIDPEPEVQLALDAALARLPR